MPKLPPARIQRFHPQKFITILYCVRLQVTWPQNATLCMGTRHHTNIAGCLQRHLVPR
jgi:hypothetical protein